MPLENPHRIFLWGLCTEGFLGGKREVFRGKRGKTLGISAFFFGTKVALFGEEWILLCLIRDCGSLPPCRSQVQTHSPTPATSCALGSAVDLGWFVGFWMMDPNVSQCPRARTTRAQKVRRACWGARSVSFPYGHPLGYGNGVRGGGGEVPIHPIAIL